MWALRTCKVRPSLRLKVAVTGLVRTTLTSSWRNSAFADSATPSWSACISRFTHARDERLPRIRQLPDGRIAHISSLYTEEEKKTSVVYNEALPLGDTRDSLNVRLDGPQSSRIVWVVADPVGGDGWSRSKIVTVERLLPHLRQFGRVRQALVNARALGSSLAMLLENTRFGVIQLDRRGRIVAANGPAGALLREADGLDDRDGRLRAAVPEEDDVLQGLLARALPPFGGQAASGSMMVSRALVLPRLVIHVTPVNRARADGDASRVRALVLAVDPAHRAAVAPEFVAATLGLTLAESHIAVWLAQGRTVRDIALATGRSAGTVRWHIKHIFTKCGISRQMELVQLVLSLADLPQTADAGAGETTRLHVRQHHRPLGMTRQRGDQAVELAAGVAGVLAAERADRALA